MTKKEKQIDRTNCEHLWRTHDLWYAESAGIGVLFVSCIKCMEDRLLEVDRKYVDND